MPTILPANQPPARFYRGGAQINALRGTPSSQEEPCFEPEDWVGSTTSCSGSHPLGLTRLPNGRLLADAIRQDPEYWLGEDHVRAFGVDTKLLVKLLDAGQRLPVHAHPHDDWVKQYLPTQAHGKAEAWYILTLGEVYLGLKEDVEAATLKQLTLDQRIQGPDGLLGRLHRLEVKPGDAVYVPPGYLHAVGQGVLVVEVQEPADLSILLEWTGFDLDGLRDGHLGLGWDTALTAVEIRGYGREHIEQLVVTKEKRAEKISGKSVFVESSEEYFVMEEIQLEDTSKTISPGFALLVVLDGNLTLSTSNANGKETSTPLTKGNTVLLAHGDGPARLDGRGQILVARPPKAE
ncbi:hypothetical protein SBRCBS47491_003483 [Sporothrix bragantina]|uniref:Mannose-6-phosphate isomerase cupin domain-containing protein n=1 Tax=Sporothrix bragantina TaxID=671064 RepID=A0ABP0BGV3_9PEZI